MLANKIMLLLAVWVLTTVPFVHSIVDECQILGDCQGQIVIDVPGSSAAPCEAIGFPPEGKDQIGVFKGCLQCPEGIGKLDFSKYPYITCNEKPLCGKVMPLASIVVAPKQLKCLWEKKEITCVQEECPNNSGNGATGNSTDNSPATIAPSPSTAPVGADDSSANGNPSSGSIPSAAAESNGSRNDAATTTAATTQVPTNAKSSASPFQYSLPLLLASGVILATTLHAFFLLY